MEIRNRIQMELFKSIFQRREAENPAVNIARRNTEKIESKFSKLI